MAIYKRCHPPPSLQPIDRLFWVWLAKIWTGWQSALLIVKPETVVGWHRKGIKLTWRKLSQQNAVGRSSVNAEIIALIKKMAKANPLWGAPRIHGELLKPGIEMSERTVSRLLPRGRWPPSQTWRSFLDNHLKEMVSIDFLTVPTVTFRALYVLIVLAPDRRRIVHFNVTSNPTAARTAQQMIEAFPEDASLRFLLRLLGFTHGSKYV
jgi:putative transposase